MGHWWTRIDEKRMLAFVELDDGESEPREVGIPIEFGVCGTCGGKGRHVNPSIDAHGITGDEWAQWSPDEQEAYLSGGYDMDCHECGGKRVVPMPAEERLTAEQRDALEHVRELARERLEDHRTTMREMGIWD